MLDAMSAHSTITCTEYIRCGTESNRNYKRNMSADVVSGPADASSITPQQGKKKMGMLGMLGIAGAAQVLLLHLQDS